MADTEQIRTQSAPPFSTWVGVVLLFVLFGAIVVAVIGPSPRGDTYEQMRAEARAKKLKEARDEASKALTSYAWVDKNKGTVRLPIDRAMELTIADLASKKPAPAYPIAVPESSAAPGGAASASPAPQSSGTPKPTSVAGQNSEARGQPAAAANPPAVQPSTQPGASASPGASPHSSTAVPAASPSTTPSTTPPGGPLPVRGATPTPGQQQ